MKLLISSIIALNLFLCGCSSAQKSAYKRPERKVAVQTYTMNSYTLEDSLNKLKPLGVKAIEAWNGQKLSSKYPGVTFDYRMNSQQRAFAKKILSDAGIKVISTGVFGDVKDEATIEKICAFAKEFGIPTIVTEARKEKLPIWSKLCKKYGLRMCIHNHQRGSANDYYDPNVVMGIISAYDNIGACPDNGAWSRSGLDSVECLKIMKGKIYEVHLKDQKVFNNLKSPAAAYGKGVLDMKAILAELDAQGFDGYFVIEHGDDQKVILDIIKQDIDFLKKN